MAVNMLRTWERFASPLLPPCRSCPPATATSSAGDGVIGAKDRPFNATGASDQELAARAKQGHEAAFRELVRRYERPVFSLLYRMVRDRALAEDLAQETFIKVLNGIKSYRPEFKFSSWIFKIANNAAIDQLRRKSIDTLSLDGAPSAETPEQMRATSLQLGDRTESPLDEALKRELGTAIARAIAELRQETRWGFRMCEIERCSCRETAHAVHMPRGRC